MDSQLEPISSYTSLLQQGSDINLSCSPLLVEAEGSKQKRGNNFSVEEDKLLISGWLNTSLDAIRGKDDSLTGYWGRVSSFFVEEKDPTWPDRSISSLSHRWSNIQLAVSKFCGFLTQIQALHKSGVSHEDNIQEARRMFHEIQRQPFHYDHCWVLLRNEQKWLDRRNQSVAKRKSPIQPTNGSTEVQDLGEDNTIERPIGRKAAKERKKVNLASDVSSFSTALSNLRDEKKKAHDEKMSKYNSTTEQRAELLEIQKAHLLETQEANRYAAEKLTTQLLETKESNRINNKKLKMQQDKDDMNIMFKDTNGMTSQQMKYIEIRRLEILQRRHTTYS